MKSGLPWNLRGVDEKTREAVIEAARLSGLSVTDWLSQVLGDHARDDETTSDASVRGANADTDANALAHSIERLTQRLGAMDDNSRAAISGLADRLDDIERQISRVPETGRAGGDRSRSLQGVQAMVKDLAREIDNADERARSMVEGLRARTAQPAPRVPEIAKVTEAISELDQRIAVLRDRLTTPAPAENRPLKLDEIRARLDALLSQPPTPAKSPTAPQAAVIDAALRALEERIDDARARVTTRAASAPEPAASLPPPMPPAATAEQITRIEGRLADIAARLAEGDAERKKPKKEAELASAIREISAHQRTIDDRAETMAMRRDQKALGVALAALRADLGALTEQVTVISRVGAEGHGAVYEVAQRIDAMAGERPLDRSQIAAIRSELETMRAMVDGGAKEATLGSLEMGHDALAAQLSDLMRMTPDPAKLDQLGEEVAALRRSLEADDSPRAIQRLEMRVSELGRAIEAAFNARRAPQEPDAAVERLEERLQDIAARIEGLRDTGAHTAAIQIVEQRLDGRLTEIAERLGGMMTNVPLSIDMEIAQQRLEGQLEEVASRLGGMFDSAVKPQTAAIETAQRQLDGRLEEIVNRLGGIFDNAPQRAAIEHVHERLQAITDRIDTLNASQREPSAALDAIKSEIGALRQEVAEKQPPTPPSTDHLESQIKDLAKQLETVTSSQGENQALADLEAQVAHLASELEHAKPRAGALHQVEETLDRLQALLADTAQESIAGARAEARKAVSELSEVVAGNEIDSSLIRGLMRDLDSLRNASGDTDQDTRKQLESVSLTVSQVVDRLSRLEIEGQSVAAETAAPERVAPATRTEPSSTPWTVAFRGAKAEVAPVPTSTKAIATVREPTLAMQAEKKAADRRADFIAAARRAAQAVADEAASIDASSTTKAATAMPPAERKPGAFSRISQAIRNRKRPLLLAAAAIVLAIGAMQVYGKFSTAISKSDLIAESGVAPADTSRGFRAIVTAANTAPTVPKVTEQALIPPAATPDAQIAFAKPEGLENRFGAGPTAPDASSFDGAPAEAEAASEPPADATDAADQPSDGGQVILASTGGDAATAIPGLDSRIGSEKLIKAAGDGDPAAAFEIATRYAEGSRVNKNLAKAAEWYSKAAEGGVAVAQYRLGSLYERGQGVAKDLTSAVNWYQRAADQGNVNAMHNLAVLMSEGSTEPPITTKRCSGSSPPATTASATASTISASSTPAGSA